MNTLGKICLFLIAVLVGVFIVSPIVLGFVTLAIGAVIVMLVLTLASFVVLVPLGIVHMCFTEIFRD